MRIGLMCSAGGGVLDQCLSAYRRHHDFFLVVDRPCGSESVAEKHAIPCQRLGSKGNQALSEEARAWFEAQGGVDFILMLYLRIVTKSLMSWVPTFNIHPALLPAFPGLNAVGRALDARARFLGATLHLATDDLDLGPMVAQASAPIDPQMSRERAEKLSFLQKTYLAMVLIDAMERDAIEVSPDHDAAALVGPFRFSPYFNPVLPPGAGLSFVTDLFQKEGFGALLS